MTFKDFCALVPRAQLVAVFTQGTYLARRWEEAGQLSLYYVPNQTRGFFVETGYQVQANEIVVVRSFCRLAQVAEYLPYIQLPRCFYPR